MSSASHSASSLASARAESQRLSSKANPETYAYSLSWADCPSVSPCMGCGARVPGWRWVQVDGCGVLTHDGNELCPEAFRFDWQTGAPAVTFTKAVAA
ncbi:MULTISPECIES: hypothetical protein [Streptomyces]|uniref:Uncharacterized protein n=1 Tax=Streptomyces ehimensis TaxID=68195 RepID=A0ABV9BH28_9ACTN